MEINSVNAQQAPYQVANNQKCIKSIFNDYSHLKLGVTLPVGYSKRKPHSFNKTSLPFPSVKAYNYTSTISKFLSIVTKTFFSFPCPLGRFTQKQKHCHYLFKWLYIYSST